ncbi:MAG: permease [Actinobacteria bacterium]|nr:permease [Actinomycetota bacterium]
MAEAPQTPRSRSAVRTRLVTGAIAVVAVVLFVLIASAAIPRWWAQRIGGQVSGSLFSGIGLGLLYGFVFTALPLLALWVVVSTWRRWQWRGRVIGLVLAAVLAVPNLMTLSIVIGNGSGARAGQRILDVEAPNFRASTLVGGFMAVGAVAAIVWLLASRRRARRVAKKASEPPAAAE